MNAFEVTEKVASRDSGSRIVHENSNFIGLHPLAGKVMSVIWMSSLSKGYSRKKLEVPFAGRRFELGRRLAPTFVGLLLFFDPVRVSSSVSGMSCAFNGPIFHVLSAWTGMSGWGSSWTWK